VRHAIRSYIVKTVVKAIFVASLALTAGIAAADTGSPFPYTPLENGMPLAVEGSTFQQLHRATVGQADGSSFPATTPENGGSQPEITARTKTFKQLHHATVGTADGSSFPWVPDENGAPMLSLPPNAEPRFARGDANIGG
jgi:hypothetical protein